LIIAKISRAYARKMRMSWIIFKNWNALFRHCLSTVQALFRHCSGTVQALFRHCSGTVNIRWTYEASGLTILFYWRRGWVLALP
jgi:hypothetical protein